MPERRLKVLFLTLWYPNRYDAMAGLFVRKHAEAVSKHADVCVLYLHVDSRVERVEVCEEQVGGVREIVVYLPLRARLLRPLDFFRGFSVGYKWVLESFGKPDVSQVNTLTRNGLLAYYLKKKHQIPYFIIEHWTRYLPQNPLYKGFLRRKLTQLVAKQSEELMTVSKMLQQAMQRHKIEANYGICYNVVDDFFYNGTDQKDSQKRRILHVSCFLDRQKNISGILHAAKILSQKRNDFELVLVGTGVDFEEMKELARELDFPAGVVRFVGEQTPREVARWFWSSHLSVIFSDYETACVSIMESLAAGVPVVSTPTGIAPDLIDEQTGKLVAFGCVEELTEALDEVIENIEAYNPQHIRQVADKFREETIGRELVERYKRAVR